MAARPLCRSATDQRRCAPVRSMAAFCAAEAASCWAKPFRPGRQKWVNLCDLQIGVEVFMHWKSFENVGNFQKDDWFFLDTWGGFEAFLAFLVTNERTTLVPTTQKFLKKSDPSHVAAPFCCLTIAAQRVRIASDQGIQLGESAARKCDLLLRHWVFFEDLQDFQLQFWVVKNFKFKIKVRSLIAWHRIIGLCCNTPFVFPQSGKYSTNNNHHVLLGTWITFILALLQPTLGQGRFTSTPAARISAKP